jgi:branched-chain amino acid transport system ATP-binding protein
VIAMPILRLEKVTRSFGGLTAVCDVSMQVRQGEITGLIGPNGAGKTTCFNLISGFLAPTTGEIFFEGRSLAGLRPHQIAGLGLVRTFQHTSLFSKLTALENVAAAHHLERKVGVIPALVRTPAFRAEERAVLQSAERILEFLGLAAKSDALAESLPYGEQRKLEIGIALAVKPKMLLLDEPAAGMNPTESLDLITLIQRIRDSGITALLVEHDMKVVMTLCDHITVLNFGELLAAGTPAEVRNHPDVHAVYLGAGVDA